MRRGTPEPVWMRPSARVDLAQLGPLRPAVRSQVEGTVERAVVRRWARRIGLYLAIDADGFFSVAHSGAAARRVLRIDARPGRHVVSLGRALGYPLCCCLAARRATEEGIDGRAEMLARRRFSGLFRLIRPDGYVAGEAFISHVPCAPNCGASLRMALAAAKVRRAAAGAPMRGSAEALFGRLPTSRAT